MPANAAIYMNPFKRCEFCQRILFGLGNGPPKWLKIGDLENQPKLLVRFMARFLSSSNTRNSRRRASAFEACLTPFRFGCGCVVFQFLRARSPSDDWFMEFMVTQPTLDMRMKSAKHFASHCRPKLTKSAISSEYRKPLPSPRLSLHVS